jgi:3-hydroxybutyryl-CoA dehydrogenase
MSGRAVGVVGAGTMGAGIAQLAAVHGHRVTLCDVAPGAAERAVASIRDRVAALVERGKLPERSRDLDLHATEDMAQLSAAGVVVEAVPEDLEIKRAVLAGLESVVDDACILASTTSSLSPTALAAHARRPERVVGLHFFNPVGVMRLVEVVPGLATAPAVADEVDALAVALGKVVVRCAPTPGFIVNRIARPYYSEPLRLHEEGAAQPATIDAVLTGAGGFPLGPFALTDLIGQDVNEAVTRSVWAAYGFDPRFAPSPAQRELVAGGRLGRKTGQGWYAYAEGRTAPAVARPLDPVRGVAPASTVVAGPRLGELQALVDRAGVAVVSGDAAAGVRLPSGVELVRTDGATADELALRLDRPVVVVDRTLDDTTASAVAIAVSAACPRAGRDEAVATLQAAGLGVHEVADRPGLVVARTVAMLVTFALEALDDGVASAADIDLAMCLGANHPCGPLAWGERWGPALVLTIMDNLHGHYGDPRYRAGSPLRRRAALARAVT